MSHYLDFPLYSWSVGRLLRLADAECERDTFWVSGYSSNSFMRNGVPHFRLSKQHLMEAAVAQTLCGEQCEYWSCVFFQDWLFKQGSPLSSLPCGLASVRWPAQLGWPHPRRMEVIWASPGPRWGWQGLCSGSCWSLWWRQSWGCVQPKVTIPNRHIITALCWIASWQKWAWFSCSVSNDGWLWGCWPRWAVGAIGLVPDLALVVSKSKGSHTHTESWVSV